MVSCIPFRFVIWLWFLLLWMLLSQFLKRGMTGLPNCWTQCKATATKALWYETLCERTHTVRVYPKTWAKVQTGRDRKSNTVPHTKCKFLRDNGPKRKIDDCKTYRKVECREICGIRSGKDCFGPQKHESQCVDLSAVMSWLHHSEIYASLLKEDPTGNNEQVIFQCLQRAGIQVQNVQKHLLSRESRGRMQTVTSCRFHQRCLPRPPLTISYDLLDGQKQIEGKLPPSGSFLKCPQ